MSWLFIEKSDNSNGTGRCRVWPRQLLLRGATVTRHLPQREEGESTRCPQTQALPASGSQTTFPSYFANALEALGPAARAGSRCRQGVLFLKSFWCSEKNRFDGGRAPGLCHCASVWHCLRNQRPLTSFDFNATTEIQIRKPIKGLYGLVQGPVGWHLFFVRIPLLSVPHNVQGLSAKELQLQTDVSA